MPERTSRPASGSAQESAAVQTAGSPTRHRHTRLMVAIGLVLSLILAGVVSLYASGSPDGLEKVAEDTGFIDTATDHAAAGSPLADYQASFLDGALGQSVAGVVGVLVTLALFYGLTRLVRRGDRTG